MIKECYYHGFVLKSMAHMTDSKQHRSWWIIVNKTTNLFLGKVPTLGAAVRLIDGQRRTQHAS